MSRLPGARRPPVRLMRCTAWSSYAMVGEPVAASRLLRALLSAAWSSQFPLALASFGVLVLPPSGSDRDPCAPRRWGRGEYRRRPAEGWAPPAHCAFGRYTDARYRFPAIRFSPSGGLAGDTVVSCSVIPPHPNPVQRSDNPNSGCWAIRFLSPKQKIRRG